MIERTILVKLKPEFSGRDERRDIAVYSKDVLSRVEHVVSVYAGEPADEKTRHDWDLYFLVELPSAEDIEKFVHDQVHRKFYEDYLKPKMETIQEWSFERLE